MSPEDLATSRSSVFVPLEKCAAPIEARTICRPTLFGAPFRNCRTKLYRAMRPDRLGAICVSILKVMLGGVELRERF